MFSRRAKKQVDITPLQAAAGDKPQEKSVPEQAASSTNGGAPQPNTNGKAGSAGAPGAAPPGAAPGGDIFKHPAPSGHAKTVSAVLGEIVWLMSQSPYHKQLFISDLEWFVMTPILHQQFRLYYAQNKPVGVALWAFVNDEVAGRLAQGINKLRPQDWKSGEQLWVVEVISPFGAPEAMVKNLKEQVFPNQEMRFLQSTTDGKKEVKVL